MDDIYAYIDDQRLPNRVKSQLETKISYTNHSLQVFFGVR